MDSLIKVNKRSNKDTLKISASLFSELDTMDTVDTSLVSTVEGDPILDELTFVSGQGYIISKEKKQVEAHCA